MMRRFLDISSGHLSPETWTWLDAQFADDALRDPHNLTAAQLAGGRTRYGWFVYAPECSAVDLPADLVVVCAYARRRRAEYLSFDCDAPPVDDLPILHPDFPGAA